MLERDRSVVFVASAPDACALWRLYMPHIALPGSSFFYFDLQPDWSKIAIHDVCVVQRLCTNPQFEFLRTCIGLGMKIVYDLDDNVWEIPKYNPAHEPLSKMRDGFITCIRMVDAVSVSTTKLATAVHRHVGKKNMTNLYTGREIPVVVAENRIEERLFSEPAQAEVLTVGWAGSSSHIGDLGLVEDAIVTCGKEFPEAIFEFRGCGLPETSAIGRLPNFRFRYWTPVAEYTARMPQWRWSVALAPVTDMPFNEAKCLSTETSVYGLKDGYPIRTTLRYFLQSGQDHHLPGPDGKWRKVTGWEYMQRCSGLSIRLRNGDHYRVTPSHRFVLEDGSYIKAKQVQPGMKFASASLAAFIPSSLSEASSVVGYDAGWFVGHFIGDGNWGSQSGSGVRGGNTQVAFSTHNKAHAIHRRLQDFVMSCGGAIVRRKRKGKGRSFYVSGPLIYGLLRQYVVGDDCYTKHLSSDAWATSPEFLRGVVDGWLAADGNERKACRPGTWSSTITRNWNLVRDMQLACSMVGYRFSYKSNLSKSQWGVFKTVRCVVRTHDRDYQSSKSVYEVLSVASMDVSTIAVEVEGDHLFVLPGGTVTHNSCIKMIEAGYCGIPCLASWVHPYADFCYRDPELRYLLCSTPSQFRIKLRELLHDRERREHLGKKMREVAIKYYSFRQPHEGWQDVFSRVGAA